MSITVQNLDREGGTVNVGINAWNDVISTKSTIEYNLEIKEKRTWDRKDERGYVMYVTKNSKGQAYYVMPNQNLQIIPGGVQTDDLIRVDPIGAR